ncbi:MULTISPECIES: class II aldolase/adducin family protein [Roseateles]|uniref:Class II aldolase/adducin family protein n=1 Tax=Pelomonas caseinilytica TaxID=2906763 RepID=A0ABS8XLJ4_9BURK|nr:MULTISPECIES: class II aldolase/adducin family protein [unclassified Roseateles]MCE4539802.1 class II aldolase/adducin family protein [Pelomonas sp. P7]HEV6965314.1 class II aldolase/adducin family protein [Roseateles sp.]
MKHAQQRQHVVDLCIELSHRGYFAGTGGNIMLRVDAGHVAVTPSAIDYFSMAAADVCILRLSDLRQVEGDRAPSVESSLHAGVLRARPEVGCSIHTHQPVASALALLGAEIPVPPEWHAALGPRLPLVGYAPSGSGWLASKFRRAVRPDINAYLMRNHGILCCGHDSAAAMRAVDDLETLARRLLSQRIGARAVGSAAGLRQALWRMHDALNGRSPS